MKLTIGWWKARDGSKWHVDWAGRNMATGHNLGETHCTWSPSGRVSYGEEHSADLIAPWTEPKLRPWKPEEVPMLARIRITSGSLWVRSITGYTNTGVFLSNQETTWTFEQVLESCEHSIDGGKTWKPCGVMEESNE